MRNLLWLTDPLMKEGILCFRDEQRIKQTTIKIEADTVQKIECDELVVFVPSNHLNSKHFFSDIKNAEKRLAVFFSEFGHEIIDSPNQLTFRYSEKDSCFYWLKTHIFEDLFAILATLDMKIILLPDFFLLPSGEGCVKSARDRLLVRLKNGEGYSLALSESDHLAKIFSEGDLINLSISPEDLTQSQSEKNFIDLLDQHVEAVNYDINFYSNSFSISKILFWLGLSKKYALGMVGMLLSALLFLSVETWLLQSSISNTIQDTENIFLEVNPKFTKLINSRAQIDQIVGQSNLIPISTIDIQSLRGALALVANLNVSAITYKPKLNQISLLFTQINDIELSLLTEAIKIKKLALDTTKLSLGNDGNYSGEVYVYL